MPRISRQGSGRRAGRLVGVAACLLSLGVAGCAGSESAFPRLGVVPAIKERLMSSNERDEAIRAMRLEQETHGDNAERQIERR